MSQNVEDQAIKAALEGKWNEAVEFNQTILTQNPTHIPALNRLARSYSQLGKNDEAILTYEKVLQIDKFNTIAAKNCKALKKNPCTTQDSSVKIITTDFVEEPGKTKTCQLVRIGDSKIIQSLQSGQLVCLVIKNHWIEVTTQDNQHVGTLADNISFQLKQLMAGGSQFQAIIRSTTTNQVSVFLRETRRDPQFTNSPSFI